MWYMDAFSPPLKKLKFLGVESVNVSIYNTEQQHCTFYTL